MCLFSEELWLFYDLGGSLGKTVNLRREKRSVRIHLISSLAPGNCLWRSRKLLRTPAIFWNKYQVAQHTYLTRHSFIGILDIFKGSFIILAVVWSSFRAASQGSTDWNLTGLLFRLCKQLTWGAKGSGNTASRVPPSCCPSPSCLVSLRPCCQYFSRVTTVEISRVHGGDALLNYH